MVPIKINGQSIDVAENTAKVYNYFSTKTNIAYVPEDITEMIVRVFALNYTRDILDYHHTDRISRSNWTQHTANTFFRTCQQMKLLCDFEVEKRHDGVIRDGKGEVYLCAEWEFDTNTIFNLKGEIDKLYQTSKKHPACDAMLFTYKVESDFNEFAEKVYNRWNELLKKNESFNLFLLTALLRKDDVEKVSYFEGIRVLVMGNGSLEVWDDYLM